VHAAAAIGASLVVGALIWILCSQQRAPVVRRWTLPVLAGYAALLAGFHLTVQRDFAESWRMQRAFWRQVVDLCPDLEDGTVIFVLSEHPHRPRAILANSWADPIMLKQIFQFPRHWSEPPRLFFLQRHTLASFRREGNDIVWTVPDATWEAHSEILRQDRVVVLKSEDFVLSRLEGSVRLGAVEIEARSSSSTSSVSLPPGTLYDYLLRSEPLD
jgi:hypothetical protein